MSELLEPHQNIENFVFMTKLLYVSIQREAFIWLQFISRYIYIFITQYAKYM